MYMCMYVLDSTTGKVLNCGGDQVLVRAPNFKSYVLYDAIIVVYVLQNCTRKEGRGQGKV